MVIAAEREPIAVGVKLTLIVQFAPAARVAPHVVVREKSPLFAPSGIMPVIFSASPPVLLRVTFWASLVVFSSCEPKFSDAGPSDTAGVTAAFPEPPHPERIPAHRHPAAIKAIQKLLLDLHMAKLLSHLIPIKRPRSDCDCKPIRGRDGVPGMRLNIALAHVDG
jgi:hypothetical protein